MNNEEEKKLDEEEIMESEDFSSASSKDFKPASKHKSSNFVLSDKDKINPPLVIESPVKNRKKSFFFKD